MQHRHIDPVSTKTVVQFKDVLRQYGANSDVICCIHASPVAERYVVQN